MAPLYALTLFTSAALLFAVQPLLGRLLLPRLGGAPAVWTTCMVFFQVALLAGYAYAHAVSARLSRRWQVGLQLALLVAASATLPFAIRDSALAEPGSGGAPLWWLLGQLVLVAGLPFFVVATTGPLLQRWFSRLGQPASADPYFLYSASNLGSLIALAAYPLWLEPRFDVTGQSRFWHGGFLALGVMILACGWCFVHVPETPASEPGAATGDEASTVPPGGAGRRARWLLLAFVPSSLMLGTTSYLTTDIASIPLLWVIPLGLYLLTFVLGFARRAWLPDVVVNRLVPVLAIVLIFALLCRATEPVWLLVGCHLLFLFLAAATCHRQLAAERPPAAQLTGYYLTLAAGGALGGLFNAVLAPWIFDDVLEYPLLIVVAAALYRPGLVTVPLSARSVRAWLPVVMLGGLAVGLGIVAWAAGWRPGLAVRALVFGLPAVLCFACARRPGQFAAALAAVWLGAQAYVELTRQTVFVERSFFGVSRVTISANGWFRQLEHGSTSHGRQFLDPARACEPLAYYHPAGPLGTIFAEFNRAPAAPAVAVIGLGTGASLAYARPGQAWDIYEIDPVVIRIARHREWFSYLSDCAAVAPRILEGDGRLRLAAAPDARYGLLILDAFSSDAIPMHLLTREAVALYFSKIGEGGWLALHVSNRYLDLEQVLAGLAREQGYAGLSWIDTEADRVNGKEESHWIVLARRESDLRGLLADPRRIPLDSRPAVEPWTDARSSLLPIFKW